MKPFVFGSDRVVVVVFVLSMLQGIEQSIGYHIKKAREETNGTRREMDWNRFVRVFAVALVWIQQICEGTVHELSNNKTKRIQIEYFPAVQPRASKEICADRIRESNFVLQFVPVIECSNDSYAL